MNSVSKREGKKEGGKGWKEGGKKERRERGKEGRRKIEKKTVKTHLNFLKRLVIRYQVK